MTHHRGETGDRPIGLVFDEVAELYDRARSAYPTGLYADLVRIGGLTADARLLEVGCGPGIATVPLAERGYRIVALEPGPSLAAVATRKLARFPNVSVVCQNFETWHPEGERFDLVYAATSCHWVDPAIRYLKAAELLRPGGCLAIWGAYHGFPAGFDPFFTEIQAVYDALGDRWEGDWPPPPPEEAPDLVAEIEASGLFENAAVQRYVWAIEYNAEAYVALLDTFSGHCVMEPQKRDVLYREIRERIRRRPAQTIIRHWQAILHVARRRSAVAPTSPIVRL